MNVEVQVNNSAVPGNAFLGWAPSPCRVRVTNPSGATSPTVSVKLTGATSTGGGEIVFRSGTTGSFSSSLTLSVPVSGASVSFFCAGKFGKPSQQFGDVVIEARVGTTLAGSLPAMVRVRKNANTLTTGERDRFIAAFAQLNNQGMGRFRDFRDMHTSASSAQAHGAAAFLPWHRAYLLDLERELQAIDASVALPYWRFDRAAPNVFTADFMGQANGFGNVIFAPSNPLRFWTTDGALGVSRRPLFNVATQSAFVMSETSTLAIGTHYRVFLDMEGDPHGNAHSSFDGPIDSVPTAARDPLFFLLHCNVDRLWAKWQRVNDRFDPAVAASYDTDPADPVGHRLADTMWPWNGVTTPPRPPTAPGGTLASSPIVAAPGPQPRVSDLLDYQGVVSSVSRQAFDYDDVRFA